jgi:cysteine synthase A
MTTHTSILQSIGHTSMVRLSRATGYVVPLWQPSIADGVERVSTDEALAMCLRLVRDEGLFGGLSTGANVVAALRVAARLGPEATVVTVMCDSGGKYLSKFSRALDASAA